MSSSSSSLPSNNIGFSEIGGQDQQKSSTGGKRNNNTTNKKLDDTTASSSSSSIISSWREKIEISIAKSRKVRGGNYVQIATVDPTTLEPRCRTVVFRGFLKPKPNPNNHEKKDQTSSPSLLPCIMKMITDKRSNKVQEVTTATKDNNSSRGSASAHNSVEMVWWFSKSSEQYRIRGQLKFVGEDEKDQYLLQLRKEQWGNLSDMAREQFYWEDPGLKFDDDDDNMKSPSLPSSSFPDNPPTGGRDTESGKVLPPPSNFLLMLLYPTKCDYLRLGDNFRQIDDVVEGDQWKTIRVNP